ncbi:MAG: YlmC/YmxH family sporulation protein [Lachnospiraceae bacterium]|nr:YlmC/YmxH family sporulation protein [Lachnospiraceae bacterium]
MRFSELCEKEVISVRDCRKLGHVKDLEFDPCNGCICKIIVKQAFCFCGFFNGSDETVIPFKDIKQIGPDIILVNI